jgi:hypothetical protein
LIIPLPFDFTRGAQYERSRTYRCSRAQPISSVAPAPLARALVALLYGYTQQSEIAIVLSAQTRAGSTELTHLCFEVNANRRLAALRARPASGSSNVGLSISGAHGALDLDAILPATHDLHFLVRGTRERCFFHAVFDARLFASSTVAELARRFALLVAALTGGVAPEPFEPRALPQEALATGLLSSVGRGTLN